MKSLCGGTEKVIGDQSYTDYVTDFLCGVISHRLDIYKCSCLIIKPHLFLNVYFNYYFEAFKKKKSLIYLGRHLKNIVGSNIHISHDQCHKFDYFPRTKVESEMVLIH